MTRSTRLSAAAASAQNATVALGNVSGTITLDTGAAALYELTMTGNLTINLTGTAAAISVRLLQDATGGRTLTVNGVTLPTGWSLLTGAGKETDITFVRWASGWRAFIAGFSADQIDPTAPTGLTPTPAANSVSLTWTAGTDNVAVTGYELKVDSGSWTNVGNVLTTNVTGLATATTYAFSVRSYDAAGNRSTAATTASTTAVTWTTVVNDTFTAADGTLINAHAPETGPSNYWSTANAAYTIVGNRFYTNLLDNTQADSSFVDSGGTILRATLAYDLTEQKVGNNSNVRIQFWLGGTRTGTYNTRSTNHILMVKKPAYNSSAATMTASTGYSSPSDTVTLTAAAGKNLAAIPLTGTLVVTTASDDTFKVEIDGVLWATGTKLVDPSGGTVTVGGYASAGIFGGKAYIDNVKLEHGA